MCDCSVLLLLCFLKAWGISSAGTFSMWKNLDYYLLKLLILVIIVAFG